MARIRNTASVLLLVAAAAATARATEITFDFEADLDGWASLRRSWHWSDRDGLSSSLPADWRDGFAVLDQASSDELHSPQILMPEGGSVSMTFYLRSKHVGSNTLTVSYFVEDESFPLLDLGDYSLPNTTDWVSVSADIPPTPAPLSLEVFCFNGYDTVPGEDLLGCALDQIVVHINCDQTVSPTEEPTTPGTEAPTEATTEPVTDTPTEPETEAPTEGPTEPETEAPTEGPTEPETEAPTEGPTEPETEAPTEGPTEPETEAPTEGPTEPETEAPTEPETEAPTEPETEAPTEPETEAPTEEPTAPPSTTETPDGPLVYAFNTGAAGWTLSHLNGATWTRREFDSNGRPVNDPPNGPWVLEIQPNEVLAGTVVAQSPLLEAVDTTMTMAVTFWMDGAEDFQAELKVRRKTDFSTFDVDPIMNLDPFGDQENHRWITYLATLDGLTPGQSFNVILEGSLGGHPNNSVAVDMVEIRGVREATLGHSSFFDFENGLRGWSSGNLEGGRWLLQAWSELDPSVGVPRPSDGENFLLVERFDIHSGVITVESPVLTLTPGAKQTLELKFWTRGSVVYPATLRIRKKTPDGRYDALPFLNLRNYGDIDNTHWISFSRQYLIPGDTDEASYQLVIEADLGSDLDNLIALDDLKITTELAAPAGRS
ncbi:uncharacterized protein LOC119593173 isoform X4 [Penaeus monodon]|uniref:uncharacterized protein LOC119593173 isoform X3 n=1 Tax=Penaeus monodon TaxID=6687 RepID=UPI0018A703C4|nr:uncharacterized protein LOC119593173 isoform X3 [Penaeus monodon]XP_037798078.1 uncharacterized protein LOC119593173 isoform X4 [Penaeus monodon]